MTLDEGQLGRLLDLLKPAVPRRQTLERMLTLAQTVAIVGAGSWAVFEYITFKRGQQQLETKRDAIQLAKSSDPRLDWNADLHIVRAGVSGRSNVYEVKLGLRARNISDEQLDIRYSIIECFLGKLGPDQEPIVRLPPPPKLGETAEVGGLTWTRVGGRLAYVLPQAHEELADFFKRQQLTPVEGGGATARLRSGETVWSNIDFVVRGSDDTWVGFVANLSARGSDGREYPRFFRKWERLGSAEERRDRSRTLAAHTSEAN